MTKDFWKKDLKTTREYLKAHTMDSTKKMGDKILEEWGVGCFCLFAFHMSSYDNKERHYNSLQNRDVFKMKVPCCLCLCVVLSISHR